MFLVRNSYIAIVSNTSSHMHERVTMMIRWFFAAHFGGDARSQIFRLHAMNTANVGSSRDISLPGAIRMEKHVGQLAAQHLSCRCFGNGPPTVYEGRFGKVAGLTIFQTQCLNTANEESSRDTSPDAAAGSVRRCCAVHPEDRACLLMLRVHSRNTLLGNSNVESHCHCAAGSRREAHQASYQRAHVGVNLFSCGLYVFL